MRATFGSTERIAPRRELSARQSAHFSRAFGYFATFLPVLRPLDYAGIRGSSRLPVPDPMFDAMLTYRAMPRRGYPLHDSRVSPGALKQRIPHIIYAYLRARIRE